MALGSDHSCLAGMTRVALLNGYHGEQPGVALGRAPDTDHIGYSSTL
jgi:hypothetical protein